jgi:PAS domain S-box-containing protein
MVEQANQHPVISLTVDPEGRCTYVDALWREFAGQSETQALGAGWLDVVHPDDIAKSRATLDAAARRQAAFKMRHRLRRPDGHCRLALAAGTPRFDASGAFIGWIGFIVDVEEEQATEQARDESEAFHHTLLEALSDGVFVAQNGRFAFANAALCAMLGHGRDDLKDIAFDALIALDSLPSWEDILNAPTGDDEPPSHHAVRLTCKLNGEPLDAELSARRIRFRGQPAVLGVLRDVTARKQAEESLRLTRENLAIAVDAAKLGTWEADYSPIPSVRRSLRHDQIFGYETLQADWEMDGARAHVLEEDRAIFDAALARARETGELDFEARVRWPNGDVRWMAARGRIFFDARGEPLRAAGVNFDITERKRAEERQTFLFKLSEALRPLADPVAIQGEACRLLGERLGVDRALYFEVEAADDGDDYVVQRDYCAPGSRSLAGRYRAETFGKLVAAEFRAGHTLAFSDTAADPLLSDAERKAYLAGGVRASLATPLVKAGRHIATFVVQRDVPHLWTAEEYALIVETAERTWDAVERARAEAALRQSEEKLRSLFESIDEGFFIAEIVYDGQKPVDFRFLDANPAFERMTGLKRAAGRRARDIMPDFAEEWLERLATAACGGESLRFEQSSAALDRCFSAYATRFGDARSHCVAVVLDDVSERKRAEATLRESEERFGAVVGSAMDAIIALDGRQRIVLFNAAAERMFGCKAGEALGGSIDRFMPRRHREGHRMLVEGFAKSGEASRAVGERGSLSGLRANGEEFPIEASISQISLNGDRLFTAIVRDITERKRTEERLKQSEERFRQVVQSLPQMVWTCEPTGRCDYLSPQWVAYTGVPEAPQLGFGWLEQVHSDDRKRTEAEWRATVESGQNFVTEYRLRRYDGVYRWFHTLAVPLHDDAGRIVKWFGSNTDITENKNAEEALRESDRRKDEFLATLAHELRNPLAPIHNAVHVLRKSQGHSLSRDRALLDMMERQVTHLVRLVDDLIQISRINRGKIELQSEHVDVASVLRDAVETSAPLIDKKRHVVVMKLGPDALPIFGDPVRLTQAFTNLLNNAAKYTPPGGRIEIEAERSGGEAIVRVRDNGLGLAQETLPRLFDLFAQFHSRAAHSEGGLGIGLALVRSLVELHGGSVGAQSAGPGRGSEFVVRLPIALAPPAAPEPRKAEPPAAEPTLRVLVIDDDRDVADSLRMLLETFDAAVKVAYDGRAGVAAACDFAPDLAFIDIGMPGMDGLETARRIRAETDGRRPKLVALTGWGQDEDRIKTRAAGFDLHLTKPASIEALEELLCRERTA